MPQRIAFATFLLDGVGASVKSPITVCMNECNRKYVVDPAKRPTLAPIHRFKISEMHPNLRRGEQLDLRVQTNQATEGFRAFVVFQLPGAPHPSAHFLQRVNTNSWDLRLSIEGGYPSDTEVLVYVFEN